MKTIFLSGSARENTLEYLIKKDITVMAVVTPFLSEQNRRFSDVILVANKYGIPVFPVNNKSIKNVLKNLSYDLLLSCGFPYLLGKEIIDNSKFAINSHPTLLPKYRGYRSGPYILINGETKTGVTVHYLTEAMDKGEIILQKDFPVSKFDTTKSIYRKCREMEPELVYQAIVMLQNNSVHPIKQDEDLASEYNYIRTPKDSFIDANRSLFELYNLIRACDPDDYPAFFYIDGEKVNIRLWRSEKGKDEDDMI